MGRVVYKHEVSPTWNINTYIQGLQQQDDLTPRDIYWRMWSLVNTLQCDQCHTPFQCADFMGCPYHPQATSDPSGGSTPTYPCCSQPVAKFSLFSSPLQVYSRQRGTLSSGGSLLDKGVLASMSKLVCLASSHHMLKNKCEAIYLLCLTENTCFISLEWMFLQKALYFGRGATDSSLCHPPPAKRCHSCTQPSPKAPQSFIKGSQAGSCWTECL